MLEDRTEEFNNFYDGVIADIERAKNEARVNPKVEKAIRLYHSICDEAKSSLRQAYRENYTGSFVNKASRLAKSAGFLIASVDPEDKARHFTESTMISDYVAGLYWVYGDLDKAADEFYELVVEAMDNTPVSRPSM